MTESIVPILKTIKKEKINLLVKDNDNLLETFQYLININIDDIYNVLENRVKMNILNLDNLKLSELLVIENFFKTLKTDIEIMQRNYKIRDFLQNELEFIVNSLNYLNDTLKNRISSCHLTLEMFKEEVSLTLKSISKFDKNTRYVESIKDHLSSTYWYEDTLKFLKKYKLDYYDSDKKLSLFRSLIVVPIQFHLKILNKIDNKLEHYALGKNQTLAASQMALCELLHLDAKKVRQLYRNFYSQSLIGDSNLLKKMNKSYNIENKEDCTIIKHEILYLPEFDNFDLPFNSLTLDNINLKTFLEELYIKINKNKIRKYS